MLKERFINRPDLRSRGGTDRRKFARRMLARTGSAVAAIAVVAASAAPTLASTHAGSAQVGSGRTSRVAVHMSAKESAEWRKEVATPAGRTRVIDAFKAGFGRYMKVGTGILPKAAGGPSKSGMAPQLSIGVTGDHFWIIASYADIVDRAVQAATEACKVRVPAPGRPLCQAAGDLLIHWANGWGGANNHGVWAAIYWWPPHITGGRW